MGVLMESPSQDHLRTCYQQYLKIQEFGIYYLLWILSFLLVICPLLLTTDEIEIIIILFGETKIWRLRNLSYNSWEMGWSWLSNPGHSHRSPCSRTAHPMNIKYLQISELVKSRAGVFIFVSIALRTDPDIELAWTITRHLKKNLLWARL